MGIDAEMWVRTRKPIDEATLKRLRWELAASFGAKRFCIWDDEKPENQRRVLQRVSRLDDDGPDDIVAEEGEPILSVNPSTRYYGAGYERGDLPFLVGVADWLERRIPGAEVWYGGDSGGARAERFDRARREEYLQHFAEAGHTGYAGDPRTGVTDSLAQPVSFDRWSLPGHPEDSWAQRTCRFCEVPMMRNGWGASYANLQCYGCGFEEVTQDSGRTWKTTHEVGGMAVREEKQAVQA